MSRHEYFRTGAQLCKLLRCSSVEKWKFVVFLLTDIHYALSSLTELLDDPQQQKYKIGGAR